MNQVLLVDDDPLVRSAVGRLLARRGVQLTVVDSAAAALEEVRHTEFDAVLTDINMPRVSGFDLLRELRLLRPSLPVVLMTGRPDADTAARALECGAFRYLPKPFLPEDLMATLTDAMRAGARSKAQASAAPGQPAPTPQPGRAPSAAAVAAAAVPLADQLDQALDGLYMAYQPIVRWSEQRALGYEALVRTSAHSLRRPDQLFSAAERLGRTRELGRTIRAAVARGALLAPADTLLFVNLHLSDLEDEALFDAAAPLSRLAGRVVLEVTERGPLDGVTGLLDRVKALRALGFRVAVDDLGTGSAGLGSFSSLAPDLVKFDLSLVRGVDVDERKAQAVASMVRLAGDLGTQLVAEGVEAASERSALVALGCDLLQGHLFGRPAARFSPPEL